MSIVIREHPLGFTQICLHFFSGFFRLAYQRPEFSASSLKPSFKNASFETLLR